MLVILGVVVLAAAGITLGLKRHPSYTASSELNVGIPDASTQATPGYVQAAETLASSYSREATSSVTYTAVSHRTGISAGYVASHLSSSVVPNSPTFYLNAKGASPSEAMHLANVATQVLQSKINANARSSGAPTLLAKYRVLQQQANRLTSISTRLTAAQSATSTTSSSGLTTSSTSATGATATGATTDKAPSPQVSAAQLAAQTAQLKAQSMAERYTTAATQTGATNLSVLNPARSASSDRASTTERYAAVGAIAGLVIGCVLAFAVARWRFRRLQAA